MTDFYSLVYGLRIRSNRPIPRVRSAAPTPNVDLDIRLNEAGHDRGIQSANAEPWYSSNDLDADGRHLLVILKVRGGTEFEMRYADGTAFVLDRLGTSIAATWPDDATVEDTVTYLLGPVLGFLLLLRGVHALHASAVAVDGGAIALAGPAGAGKSTTAAAFATRGYPVLAEDVVALAPRCGDIYVQPAYPCIRLWPESVEALFGARDALPLLTPNWDKCYLELDRGSHRFQKDPLRLTAVFVIGNRSGNSAAPRIEAISPSAALIALTRNSYVPYLKDKTARGQEFELLRQLVARVPVRRVIPHTDPGRIADLCNVILDNVAGRTTSHVSTADAVEFERV